VAGNVLAYLDVWEHLVTPTDDPSLILLGLGTESCSRMKREWMVRVRAGGVLPQPADADFVAGHSYYALALIARRAGEGAVQPGDITDLRERHLQVMPTTLIADTLGMGVNEYRHGQQRPAVNLRSAINGLLRGDLPESPIGQVPAPSWASISAYTPGVFLDQSNGIVAIFESTTNNGQTYNAFASRLDLANAGAGFGPPYQLTTAAAGRTYFQSQGAQVPNGDLIVVWTDRPSVLLGSSQVRFKRGTLAGLGAAPEQSIGTAAESNPHNPTVVVTGNIATFFFAAYDAGGIEHLYYRRFRLDNNSWIDTIAPQILAMPGTIPGAFSDLYSVSVDTSGNIWIAAQGLFSDRVTWVFRFLPDTATSDHPFALSLVVGPHILTTSSGTVWVLGKQVQPSTPMAGWVTPGIRYAVFDGQSWQANQFPLIHTGAATETPRAVEAGDGGIWFFWSESYFAIHYMRGWGVPRQLTLRVGVFGPLAVSAGNSIYVLWGQQTPTPGIYFQRLLSQI
jgi:hypothetical protein